MEASKEEQRGVLRLLISIEGVCYLRRTQNGMFEEWHNRFKLIVSTERLTVLYEEMEELLHVLGIRHTSLDENLRAIDSTPKKKQSQFHRVAKMLSPF